MTNQRLAAWRAQRTEELSLPSGLVVTVQRLGILDAVMDGGELPKPLLGLVEQLQQTGEQTALGLADVAQFMPLINATVARALLDPPVAAAPDADHLSIEELPADDRLAIFNWLNGPARQIAPFRAQSAGAVAAASDGSDV